MRVVHTLIFTKMNYIALSRRCTVYVMHIKDALRDVQLKRVIEESFFLFSFATTPPVTDIFIK